MEKNFENWLWEDIEQALGMVRVVQPALMQAWEACAPPDMSEPETTMLEKLRVLLETHHQDWNEEELKLNFIAPLLSMINYYNNSYDYQPFAERTLKATIGAWEVSGTVDWLLAKGKQNPKKPFFFLHEYKRTKMGDSDPLGQLLIAMLTAQQTNEELYPIFGAYIIGKDWYFVLVQGSEYAISKPYQAIEKEELMHITAMLFEVKNLAIRYIFA